MSTKQLAQKISIGIIIIVGAIVTLLEHLDIIVGTLAPPWYLVIVLAFAMIFLVLAIFNHSHIYLWLTFLLAGVYLSVAPTLVGKSLSYSHTWPLLFISLGVGLMLSLMFKKSNSTACVGTILILIFTPILIGLWTNTWQIVLSVLALVAGVLLILYSIFTAITKKRLQLRDTNYYVRPSEENFENKGSNT